MPENVRIALERAKAGDTVVIPPCDWGYWVETGREAGYNPLTLDGEEF